MRRRPHLCLPCLFADWISGRWRAGEAVGRVYICPSSVTSNAHFFAPLSSPSKSTLDKSASPSLQGSISHPLLKSPSCSANLAREDFADTTGRNHTLYPKGKRGRRWTQSSAPQVSEHADAVLGLGLVGMSYDVNRNSSLFCMLRVNESKHLVLGRLGRKVGISLHFSLPFFWFPSWSLLGDFESSHLSQTSLGNH